MKNSKCYCSYNIFYAGYIVKLQRKTGLMITLDMRRMAHIFGSSAHDPLLSTSGCALSTISETRWRKCQRL